MNSRKNVSQIRRLIGMIGFAVFVIQLREMMKLFESTASSSGASHSSQAIPRLLHFVYVSNDLQSDVEIPEKAKIVVTAWSKLHPHWEVGTWSNAEVRQEFPELTGLLSRIKGPRSWVANILRYAIVYRFGGIYLDTDVVPIRSLDPLLSLSNFTVCEKPMREAPDLSELLVKWDECVSVCNAVIASTKRSPALREALSTSINNTKLVLRSDRPDRYLLNISGPPIWTFAARKHQVNVLYSGTFYPCHWERTNDCVVSKYEKSETTFGMHQWARSWLIQAMMSNLESQPGVRSFYEAKTQHLV